MTQYKRLSWRRALARALVAALAAALALLLGTATGRYLLRAAWEEGKILARRRPIAELLADSTTPPATRAKLRLVLAARAFAHDSLGLRTRQSFTTFSAVERDTLVLVLSAAYRDRLERYTWWFPIVGRVPYKGFFDFDAARRAARDLELHGLDARLGTASAFSTLGFFDDPLLPSTLAGDSLTVASTVIHELTHNTLYAPGGAVFNESFATFVGARGTELFFRSRGQAAAAEEAAARWEDDRALGRFWGRLYTTLDSAFRAHPGREGLRVAERLALRDSIYAEARERLVHDVAPRLRTVSPRGIQRIRLDNAVLLARRVYLTDLDLFDAVFARAKGDLRRAVGEIVDAVHRDPEHPFEAVGRLARAAAGA